MKELLLCAEEAIRLWNLVKAFPPTPKIRFLHFYPKNSIEAEIRIKENDLISKEEKAKQKEEARKAELAVYARWNREEIKNYWLLMGGNLDDFNKNSTSISYAINNHLAEYQPPQDFMDTLFSAFRTTETSEEKENG
jgi:hypothetical protein